MLVQLFKVPRTARKIMICVNDPASASCRVHTCMLRNMCTMPCVRPVDICLKVRTLAALSAHCVPTLFVPYGALIGSVKRLSK